MKIVPICQFVFHNQNNEFHLKCGDFSSHSSIQQIVDSLNKSTLFKKNLNVSVFCLLKNQLEKFLLHE